MLFCVSYKAVVFCQITDQVKVLAPRKTQTRRELKNIGKESEITLVLVQDLEVSTKVQSRDRSTCDSMRANLI